MRKSILRFTIAILTLSVAGAAIYRHSQPLPTADGEGIDPPAPASPAYRGKLRFLALGDSYTIGESVQPEERWPVQLASQIRKQGIDLSDPLIIARTGWTTGDLLDAVHQAKLSGKYDLVTLLIGVNNQFQGRSEDEYRTQFAELLTDAISLASGHVQRVVVFSIPDWGATPFGHQYDPKQISAAIDRFNAINHRETAKAGAGYVDITPGSRTVTTQPDLVADDGLHPSGKLYEQWVTAALPAITRALSPQGN